MTSAAQNRAIVEAFWPDLYRRDFGALGKYFHADSRYTDVASPPDDVAVGPTEIAARLELGLGPLESLHEERGLMVAEGDTVVTEHVEVWKWPTGEEMALPFCSVQELRDGRIARWWDYWDMTTLVNAAPAWWFEHVMKGYR
jgi:limonene-1,2-epoxide hydrolase